MRPGNVVAGIVALAGIAHASIPGLPDCANPCITIPQECIATDYKCICSDRNFITNISCCVAQNCNAADQATIIKFADNLCGPYGVSLPSTATCASTATATATGAASQTPTAQGAAASGNSTVSTHTVTTTTTTTASASTGQAAAWLPGAMQAGGVAGGVIGLLAWL